MKATKEMYDWMKNAYEEGRTDIYWIKRIYNDFSDEFWLIIAFGIDWYEDWGDDSIYCYFVMFNELSIVFNWGCSEYNDWDFYKDTVNYLLELEENARKIKERITVKEAN